MQKELCKWYTVHARILPWRQTRDPYLIWVSEIMLQQTQVNTVIPYYLKFIAQFSCVEQLAKASDEQLILYWQGLGYYQRARNLRKGAQQVVAQFDSKLPSDLDLLLSLSGIGPYTAGAIASIAFGIKAPAVDGNVFRVMSRYLGIDLDISMSTTRKYFEDIVIAYLKDCDPSIFNQALMELGATVCTKQLTKCDVCPISDTCYAFKHQVVKDYPKKTKKIKQKSYTYGCALIISQEGLLISKNDERLLEGFWHLPQVDCESERYFKEWLEDKYGIADEPCQLVNQNHLFTHQKWMMSGYVYYVSSNDIKLLDDDMWYSSKDIDTCLIALAHKKLIAKVKKNELSFIFNL